MSIGLESGRTEMRVYKYGTGEAIPAGATYLSTVKQEQILQTIYSDAWQRDVPTVVGPCWLVWHYFLVEVPV